MPTPDRSQAVAGAVTVVLAGVEPLRCPRARLKARILVRVRSCCGGLVDHQRGGGSMNWKHLRWDLGGQANTLAVREAVEELLAEGELCEVWLAPRGGRDAEHLLVLPAQLDYLARPIGKLRARRDLIPHDRMEEA